MATEIYVPDARDGHLPVEPKSAYATTVEEVPAATPNGTSLPYPKLKRADGTISDFHLEDRPIDEIKKLKVAIIGTGLSGVTAGALLPVKVPGIDLTLFEKNPDVGGTWFENTYPGVRCDVPSTVYQSTFEPKSDWSEEFARGDEIRDYWQDIARKYGVYEKTQFKTKVQRADWDTSRSKWKLTLKKLDTNEVREEFFDFLIPAIGHFNAWKIPDYPGVKDYKGFLRHSSNWDPSFDLSNKRVAVIGNGASGIQVVPELQKIAAHLDHYARSPTWIAGSLGGRDRQAEPMPFSPEQLEEFKDPHKFLAYRKALEETYWRRFGSVFKDGEESKNAREKFIDLMAKRLTNKPELLDQIVPAFSPHCRRLTPGPGYLEALTQPNVSFIRTPIARFTETGIVTEDGVHREVDAVICSTGANVSFAPPFPITSGEYDLSRDWQHDGKFGFPYSYFGLGVPGFPNLLFLYGPNSGAVAGTIPMAAEAQTTYISRLLRKVSRQHIQTAAPSRAAADDFVAYCDAFFPKTVFSENCKSWYNGGRAGARVHGVWPGSGAHVNFIRQEPRWEDWEWGYEQGKSRFSYWGNGRTAKEQDPESDLLSWLKVPAEVDLKDLHEKWYEV
ncbi:putative sterigmatocystin biosynthesis monooxygenase stcW [Lasiodiplodia hormozganensis]|uniref:Sterigmatocystin biosynthesis monooxygenase stcW n=1 Tax=Lasiodiplodia hormozganensis TaxID=869390 RepID=A0AA39X637_9PEZI|nr:putative sterigmatocystin biosynthesis monooxygenase stcW [Lasiodiplodia hormozganensis]